MVAEPSNGAIVTAFPQREAEQRAQQMLELLASIVDEGGTWEGTQAELAERFSAMFATPLSDRTARRYIQVLRDRKAITSTGRGTKLVYGLTMRPQQRMPIALRNPGQPTPANASEPRPIQAATPATTPASVGRGVDGTPATSGVASRAGGSLSSSSSSDPGQPSAPNPGQPTPASSSDPGHTTENQETPAKRDDGDGGDSSGPMVLTARGELLALFGVDVDRDMANQWAGFDAHQRTFVRRKFRTFPPRTDPTNPPPAYIHALFDSAANTAGADALRELLDVEPLDAPATDPPPRTSARAGAGQDATPQGVPTRPLREPTFAWSRALPWIVSAVALVAVLFGRRSKRAV